ncbi:hypothetical protein [Roseivivax sediminis]|uniref:Uncharacterized protein n=1 Tax=Roseivivax sediminis TaxID=936889 RepID=A0A1I2C4X6_9RHOB|nr:hypothetical protein [Roseivivax sediminis]SFE63397.1 hypothetical protein SAMN04515678_112125 [Roseivivax sediminis]
MRTKITIFALRAAGPGASDQLAKIAAVRPAAYPGAGSAIGLALSLLSLCGLLFGLVSGMSSPA